mgnify:CR=1 FL=1
MISKIIEYIRTNRVSSTEISDVLQKKGSLLNIRPLDYGNSLHKVGKIRCIFAFNDSNYLVHVGAKKIKKNDIVIIFTKDCKNNSIIGDIICKFILLYKEASAIVVMGNVRDIPILYKEKYPLWCQGFNPVGVKNGFTGNFPNKLKKEILSEYEGGIAVCDLSGVVVIKKNLINKKFLNNIKFIEKQEDIWYDCLDRKKWDTKKIIVDKAYKKK